jgi:RHS repeat-associated protein
MASTRRRRRSITCTPTICRGRSDAAKTTVWEVISWLPWGAPYWFTGSANLDARFPGQWFQLESGLHYNWHRHYDPTLGRYTQADPLGLVDGPSLYGYAKGNPQVYVDTDGRIAGPAIRCFLNPGCRTLVANYCKNKLKEFWKDEQGARKRDLKEVDDVIKELEKELGKKIDKDMRQDFHREIHQEFGKGSNPSYQELLNLGRSLWK